MGAVWKMEVPDSPSGSRRDALALASGWSRKWGPLRSLRVLEFRVGLVDLSLGEMFAEWERCAVDSTIWSVWDAGSLARLGAG